MVEIRQENFLVMPHTCMEFPDNNTIRVWKTDSLEPDINTYAALNESNFHNGTIEVDVCSGLLPDAPDKWKNMH